MKKKKYIPVVEETPWRKGNDIKCLRNGDIFFPAMLASIEVAKKYILMEMYLFASGNVATNFIDALSNAARKDVNVYLFLDDFGSWALSSKDRKRLTESGVFLSFYNPLKAGKWLVNLHRNHRKLLIIDGVTLFTGGTGITDDFSPSHQPKNFWRETMIEISGPVVSDWQSSFQSIWNQCGKPAINLPLPRYSNVISGVEGRLALFQAPHHREIMKSIINRIRKSRRRIWIETAYFIPSWKIRRGLKKAARNGVDVRLLLPGRQIDHPFVRRISQCNYQSLLRNGVRIFEYEPRFLHSKVMLCDDWVSIGSSNLDKWSLSWNMEANQEIIDNNFAEHIARMYLLDLTESREIDYMNWLLRPWFVRILENFWESIMIWTEYLIKMRTVRILRSSHKGIRSFFQPPGKRNHH